MVELRLETRALSLCSLWWFHPPLFLPDSTVLQDRALLLWCPQSLEQLTQKQPFSSSCRIAAESNSIGSACEVFCYSSERGIKPCFPYTTEALLPPMVWLALYTLLYSPRRKSMVVCVSRLSQWLRGVCRDLWLIACSWRLSVQTQWWEHLHLGSCALDACSPQTSKTIDRWLLAEGYPEMALVCLCVWAHVKRGGWGRHSYHRSHTTLWVNFIFIHSAKTFLGHSYVIKPYLVLNSKSILLRCDSSF